AGDLDRAGVGGVRVASHAPHDPLREAEPDLVVVLELGVAAEIDESGLARGLVARRVEAKLVALTCAHVSLGSELRPRPSEREVHVEEDGFQVSHSTTSSSRCLAPGAQATVCT